MDSYLLIPAHWYSTIDQPHRSHTRDTLIALVRDLFPREISALAERARDARRRILTGLIYALLSFTLEPVATFLVPPSNPSSGLLQTITSVTSWFFLIGGSLLALAYMAILSAVVSMRRQFATALAQVTPSNESASPVITWLLEEELIEMDRAVR